MSVASEQRFARHRVCPICGGHAETARGRGERCWGFLSADGTFAHCSRAEFAGKLLPGKDGMFAHRVGCRCSDACTCAERGKRSPGCWCAAGCRCCRCGVAHGQAGVPRDRGAIRVLDDDGRREAALRIWRGAKNAADTPVAVYLRGRGITSPIPPSIRYLARGLHRPSGLRLDVMVAGVQDPAGKFAGVHRTFLQNGAKAPVDPPKMMLGPVRRGAVRLAAATEVLAVAEGIETALAVTTMTGFPTWAALSAVGLELLELPPIVRRVEIFTDADARGLAAARKAADRWVREGRAAAITRPRVDGTDFADVLLEQQRRQA